MTSLYILGGRRNAKGQSMGRGHAFEKAMICELDVETGGLEIRMEYESPIEVRPDDEPSLTFKAAYLDDDRLYACTETEVIIYRVPQFEQVGYLSLPCFNDLHFVRPTLDGNLLIAVTGLDMVMEVTLRGEVLRQWDVLGRPLWQRFSPEVDYRKVPCTKPHEAHPNYVFLIDDEIWVNRLSQHDATCLTKPSRWIPIRTEKNFQDAHCGSHDGIVRGGKVYFTTVNGHVVVADCATCAVEHDYDLNRGLQSLGWCRGIHVIDENHAIVGFTRLRATRHTEHLSWLNGGLNYLKRAILAPTRVALYDLPRRKVQWEQNLESVGMDAVFSIHEFDPEQRQRKHPSGLVKELVAT